MSANNPFNVDAATVSEEELTKLPAQGGAAVRAFCGIGQSAMDWHERGVCVLKARKGFGKSHLLKIRSSHHRDSEQGARTVFYPQGGRPRALIDAFSSLHAVVPRWLQGKDSISAWISIWQLSILGLLVWLMGARHQSLRGYSEWFSSLEDLEKIEKENSQIQTEGGSPTVILTWFMGRVLENLPQDDFKSGAVALQQGLYYANSDWAIAIKAKLAGLGKARIAMYLDAPDELVELSEPTLWRNVQQSLLLAIWKLSKNTAWTNVLNIYASVRSEAFGADDHPDVPLAMGLAMPLHYDRGDLEAMLNDRIRQADPLRLTIPLSDAQSPVHALCGFTAVTHENRTTSNGGRYVEGVFDSMLRHTRMVPREVIGIGGSIYEMLGERSFEAVRTAVNATASRDIQYATKHSFLGWSEAVHGAFAASLRGEVIGQAEMKELAAKFGPAGPKILKFFIQHGLIGVAEPAPNRHRHFYLQRFSFDEIHGNEDSSAVDKNYFFVHPALKEWINHLPEKLNTPDSFVRHKIGVVGDFMPYEAKEPFVKLGLVGGQISIRLGNNQRLIAEESGRRAESVRALFGLLWVYRLLKQSSVCASEFHEIWPKIQSIKPLQSTLRIFFPINGKELGERWRYFQRKINSERSIQVFHQFLVEYSGAVPPDIKDHPIKGARPLPFMTVSARSSMGVQPEFGFPLLPWDQLDWDESLRPYVSI